MFINIVLNNQFDSVEVTGGEEGECIMSFPL